MFAPLVSPERLIRSLVAPELAVCLSRRARTLLLSRLVAPERAACFAWLIHAPLTLILPPFFNPPLLLEPILTLIHHLVQIRLLATLAVVLAIVGGGCDVAIRVEVHRHGTASVADPALLGGRVDGVGRTEEEGRGGSDGRGGGGGGRGGEGLREGWRGRGRDLGC